MPCVANVRTPKVFLYVYSFKQPLAGPWFEKLGPRHQRFHNCKLLLQCLIVLPIYLFSTFLKLEVCFYKYIYTLWLILSLKVICPPNVWVKRKSNLPSTFLFSCAACRNLKSLCWFELFSLSVSSPSAQFGNHFIELCRLLRSRWWL